MTRAPATPGSLITQTHHARVKAARRLAKRAFRAADRRFVVEGPQGVREALAEPGALLELFTTPDAATRHQDLVSAARAATVPVHTVTGAVMAEIAQTVTPQGILGISPFRDVSLDVVLAGAPTLVVVLAHARDPGNVGTILRAADAAGADAVVVTDSSVDVYNAKCTRSSAGSVFHVPLVVGVEVGETVTKLKDAGVQVLAARADAEAALDDTDLRGAAAWLFGNEAWGLPPEVADLADLGVRVPIYGRAESLNLATAAAVCLYASARAQRQAGGCRT
jgi:TrmH family RNA methyltransferase